MQCLHKPGIKTCMDRIPVCKKCGKQLEAQINYKYVLMKVFEFGGIMLIGFTSSDIRNYHSALSTALAWSNLTLAKIFVFALFAIPYALGMSAIQIFFRIRILDYHGIEDRHDSK